MRFLYYWLISVGVALIALIERFINGYSNMFWFMIVASLVFLLAAYGYDEEDDTTK